jgi:hypothetical protein
MYMVMVKHIINMKRLIMLLAAVNMFPLFATAQIGYQVSLLNSATGEPRANESVKVKIEITNSENTVICTEEKDAKSNEFGVLSLSVGHDKTFEDVDWTKAPFYVSATVDGALIGKSQILTVPIAEVAKSLVSVSRDTLEGTWGYSKYSEGHYYWYNMTFTFNDNKSGTVTTQDSSDKPSYTYEFVVIGDIIEVFGKYGTADHILYHNGKLYSQQGVLSYH